MDTAPQKIPLSIRQAHINDVRPLALLFDAYREFYKQDADINKAQQFLQERIKNNESVIFIAEQHTSQDPIMVGFAQLYPSFSSTRLKKLWILNDLFVSPPMRGLGIGTALLEAVKTFAHSTKACEVALSTQVTNNTAQKLYEKNGYERDSEFYYYTLSLSALDPVEQKS